MYHFIYQYRIQNIPPRDFRERNSQAIKLLTRMLTNQYSLAHFFFYTHVAD